MLRGDAWGRKGGEESIGKREVDRLGLDMFWERKSVRQGNFHWKEGGKTKSKTSFCKNPFLLFRFSHAKLLEPASV